MNSLSEFTLGGYTFFSALVLFTLYFIVSNSSVRRPTKLDPKPKIKPMKLFDGTNGLSDKKIKDHLKLK